MSTRANIGFDLDGMIANKAGAAAVRIVHKTVDGILHAYGTTVPTDGTTDPAYAVSCMFHQVDADVLFSGTCSAVGTATTLTDSSLTTTYDTDNELIGLYVIDTDKKILGLITDYAQSTGVVTVADWTDYAGTAVANTIFPAATADFKILRRLATQALFVNQGDLARGCRFKAVIGANGGGGFATVDMQKGPSPAIWDACPLLELMFDPGKGFLYWNDFLGEIDVTSGDGWTLTQVTNGIVNGVATIEGGAVIFDSNGNATADDGIEAQLTNCMVKSAAGITIYYEARVKIKDTGDDQYYIGLAGVDTSLMAAGVVDDVVDKCGWFRDSGASPADDKLSTIISRTSTEDESADKATVADDTWVKLGFVINGLTDVKFYVDGVLVQTNTTTASIPNAVMCLSFVSKIEQTSADSELTVDWVRLAQIGGRN